MRTKYEISRALVIRLGVFSFAILGIKDIYQVLDSEQAIFVGGSDIILFYWVQIELSV